VTKRTVTNIAASVHQRLKNEAAASGQVFNSLLQHYALERFIYRLSKSRHAGQFILKGALLLRVWGLPFARPTRDIDLLGRTRNEAALIAEIIREVCTTAVSDDGLSFDSATVSAAPIAEDAAYQGIRVELNGRLGNARIAMQIVIGFGDRITPAAKVIEYPSVLGMERPRIHAYPPETSIAEKFQIMLYRGTLNSRMKDFFDIWALAQSLTFEGSVLADAIRATCKQRKTPVDEHPVAFSELVLNDRSKQVQWAAFRRRLGGAEAPATFLEVASSAARFLDPVIAAVARGLAF